MNKERIEKLKIVFRTLVCLTAVTGTGLRILISFYIDFGFPIFLYFTVQSNIAVCAFLLVESLHHRRGQFFHPAVQPAVVLYILITGIVYNTMLAPGMEVTGINQVTIIINHTVTPLLFITDWLINSRHGGIKWKHYLLWMIYPIAYLIASSIIGALTNAFLYPFLDFLHQPPAFYTAGLIVVIGMFFAVGALLMLLDKKSVKSPQT